LFYSVFRVGGKLRIALSELRSNHLSYTPDTDSLIHSEFSGSSHENDTRAAGSRRVSDTTSQFDAKGDAMAKFSKSRPSNKPAKPHPDFPLFADHNGQWCKKVRQKLWYFGPWNDPQGALNRWLQQKDDFPAGRTPRPKTDGLRPCHPSPLTPHPSSLIPHPASNRSDTT
jgi:hypothetical protein